MLPGKRVVTKWHWLRSKYRYVDKIEPNVALSDADSAAAASDLELRSGTQPTARSGRERDVRGCHHQRRARAVHPRHGRGRHFATRDFATSAKLQVVGDTKVSGVTETAGANILKADSS